jgi:hypothetical protein
MHTELTEIIKRTPLNIDVAEFSFEHYTLNCFELFKKGLPFIVKDFTDVNKDGLLLEKVIEYYGNLILKARFNATPEEYANKRKYIEISLKDYIEDIFSSSEPQTFYAAKNTVDDKILELFNIAHPITEFSEIFRSPNLWIGPKGSTTPLHKDSTDNFSIQLIGTKRWIVFSVREVDKLGLQKTRYGNYKPDGYDFQVSLQDIENLRKEFSSYEILVPEGSLFYLPYGWAHFVENMTSSMMINYWLKPENYIPLILK